MHAKSKAIKLEVDQAVVSLVDKEAMRAKQTNIADKLKVRVVGVGVTGVGVVGGWVIGFVQRYWCSCTCTCKYVCIVHIYTFLTMLYFYVCMTVCLYVCMFLLYSYMLHFHCCTLIDMEQVLCC